MRKLKLTLVFLACIAPAWGAESLRVASQRWFRATAPNAAPYSTQGSFRLEMRVHNWTNPSGNKYLGSVVNDNFAVSLDGSSNVRFYDSIDKLVGGGNYVSVSLVGDGRADFVVRAQRNMTTGIVSIEVWDSNGSNYAVNTAVIGTPDSVNLSGSVSMPGGWPFTVAADVAYFRWFGSMLALNSAPPTASQRGDLGSWEFEGNLNDSSAHGLTMAAQNGDADYSTTPALASTANAGADTTMRASAGGRLDGSASFAEGATPTYLWEQIPGPQGGPNTAAITGETTTTPTLSGLVEGQYTFQLTVTDGVQEPSTDTVNVGVVVADAAGRITLPSASVAKILGPQLVLGVAPWTWFDDRHKALADFFGALQATDYLDDWNSTTPETVLPGTVSIALGGKTITGVNTTFKHDFCSGGTSPDSDEQAVLWYGGSYRLMFSVNSCVSDTEMTVWDASEKALTGASYSKMAADSAWRNGSSNVNYYDNVIAFYSLYYRTGLTVYRDYARVLADRWWTSPAVNQCEAQKNGWSSRVMAPRLMSLTGLVLRALDGQSSMWTGLKGCMDYYAAVITNATPEYGLYDIRETAYQVSAVALGAMVDPTKENRDVYVAALENVMTDVWVPNQKTHGNWTNPTYGYASFDGAPGTIQVTHDSATVIGTNTPWSATYCYGASCDGWPFWVPNDPVAYTVTYVSPTQLTLNRPYEGTSRSNEGWQLNNLVGHGTQPFMMGIVGRAWYLAYQALAAAASPSAPTARQFVLDSADWITAYGYSTAGKSLYYGVDYPNCLNPETDPGCGYDGTRYTNAEVMGLYALAYVLTGDAKYKTQGDKLFGAEWGGPSSVGPEADGTYPTEYDAAGATFSAKKAKNFGFGFGYGGSPLWPAARISAAADLASGFSGSINITGAIQIQP